MKVTFIPSKINSTHSIHLNGVSTNEMINLHAYKNPDCKDYRIEVDQLINKLIKKKKLNAKKLKKS